MGDVQYGRGPARAALADIQELQAMERKVVAMTPVDILRARIERLESEQRWLLALVLAGFAGFFALHWFAAS